MDPYDFFVATSCCLLLTISLLLYSGRHSEKRKKSTNTHWRGQSGSSIQLVKLPYIHCTYV